MLKELLNKQHEGTGTESGGPGTESGGTGTEVGVLLEEAVWLRVKEMEESLQLKEDEVVVRLLADLQDHQDREVMFRASNKKICALLVRLKIRHFIEKITHKQVKLMVHGKVDQHLKVNLSIDVEPLFLVH